MIDQGSGSSYNPTNYPVTKKQNITSEVTECKIVTLLIYGNGHYI